MTKKVIIAMSGGVDSSVAAYLLKKQGYDVIGVTMSISSLSSTAVNDAKNVAERLGIPHFTVDLSNKFEKKVIKPFVNEYLSGKTPNPCVLCNRQIKWELLMDCMANLNADYVATGHYAEIVKLGQRHSIKKARCAEKDQTYALYRLTQEQLLKTIMPLYNYTKDEIRSIAKDLGLDIFDKADSQDICFIQNNNYKSFITDYSKTPDIPGDFVLTNGTVIGTHKGVSHYTVGQRKGLGISYKEALFVLKIDTKTNIIIVGRNEELFKAYMSVINVNFTGIDEVVKEMECYGKIRYSHAAVKCKIIITDKILCSFTEPQRAITPGQSAVFYNSEGVVLAGGIIE